MTQATKPREDIKIYVFKQRKKRKLTGKVGAQSISSRGKNIFLRKEYKKAFEALDKAISANPSNSAAYAIRAGIYGSLGQYGKAISDCAKAKELNPYEFLAYLNSGIVYMKLGDFEKAITELTRAIELRTDFAGSYKYRGLVYREIGEFDLALADFKTAYRLNPNDPEVQAALKEFR